MLEGFRVKPAGVRVLVFLLGGLAALLMVVGIALVVGPGVWLTSLFVSSANTFALTHTCKKSTLEVPTREIDIDAYNSAVEVAPVWNSGYGVH